MIDNIDITDVRCISGAIGHSPESLSPPSSTPTPPLLTALLLEVTTSLFVLVDLGEGLAVSREVGEEAAGSGEGERLSLLWRLSRSRWRQLLWLSDLRARPRKESLVPFFSSGLSC